MMMKELIRSSLLYSTVRLLLFVLCLLVAFLIPGLRERPLVAALGAVAVTAIFSLFFLKKLREPIGASVLELAQQQAARGERVRTGERDGVLSDEEADEMEQRRDTPPGAAPGHDILSPH